MKAKIAGLTILFLVLAMGVAGAQTQLLMDGATIPQFVDPLPVAGDITVIDATSAGLNGATTFPVAAHEFLAQILPTGMPASWAWGYLTTGDDPNPNVVRPSYLGPVIIAERGVPAYPDYINNLPIDGNVQLNLPIDMTLDWALAADNDCQKVLNGLTGLWEYQAPCGDPYTGPIPIATHLHGGEVAPAFDGGPDAWFTPNDPLTGLPQKTGIGYPGSVYEYPNDQQESTIWFHDHALGITRLNVYAGLAGVYPIIDPANPPLPKVMPAFPAYDIPLIIQDRSFDTNGQLFYNLASNPQPNPLVHPFWIPEFIGDTIVVNGKTWPRLEVEPRQYRFRYVNGSNARFYELTFNQVRVNKTGKRKVTTKVLPQLAIATDDGYLVNATATDMLVLGPGERYEVIVDFGGLPMGSEIIVKNSARTPYPGGGAVIKDLTDTVMQINVSVPLDTTVPDSTIAAGTPIRPTPLEPIVNAHDSITGLITGSITRQLTLNEVIGPGGPLELVVNNSKFNHPIIIPGSPTTPLGRETELPAIGDTEIWEIINITADAHPMHLHLTSFQVLDRTPFEATPWITLYDSLLLAWQPIPGHGPPNTYNVKNADGAIGGNPAINPFLKLDQRAGPLPYEMGWKDTVITYPGEVTRIAVRWATTDTPVGPYTPPVAPDYNNTYPFDPTALTNGVGYVWHCHIIDHEDNEMMRNYLVGKERQPIGLIPPIL